MSTLRKLGPRQVAEAYFVGALWWYSASVLYPARLLRRRGVRLVGEPVGEAPVGVPRPGLGRRFSENGGDPVLLEETSEHQHLVEEFDEPAWFNALSAPLGRLADPGWIGWKTPREFRALLEAAGFARTCWIPLLPGFGITVGQKPERVASV